MEILSNLSLQHIAVAALVYFASIAFYRLYLHPLAKFPGPKLAAVSRWYEGYYDVICSGHYTFKIEELHKKYGPVVRISPYELHVNDSTFFEKLYRQDGRWDKYDWSADAFGAPLTTVCSVAHDLHKRRRAPLNPLFSKSNVASKQDMIKRLIEKLCHRLDEAAGSQIPINLGVAISAFTRDASTDFMLGKSYNNLDKEDFNAAMTKTIIGLGTIWRITKHVPWVGPLMLSLPYSLAKKLGDDGIKAFFTFLESTRQDTMDIMAAAAAQTPDPEAPRTIVHGIMQSNLPQAEKTFNRVTEEVTSVAGAAFESTASAMRLILYYVYTDAVILQRLRDELASLRKRAGTVDHSWATLEQLPYLTGVLYEGLRRSPAIATRSARIAPDRDLICGEWHIPAGTPVGMTTLLMHRDEKLYPDPYRFDPERWVALETRKKADKTFVPFSRGTRNCLGMHLAWAELYLVISTLVQRFDFKFDGAGPKDVECVRDQFIIGVEDQSGIKAYVRRYEG